MTTKSGINWTNTTWSPVTGCTKVSEGCKHCYAEREVETRWSKNPKSVFFDRKFTDVQTHPEQLYKPLHWKNPQRIFVCPRADLFHESVPDEFISAVFATIKCCQEHTFQVLTKRPERMLKWVMERDEFFREVGYPQGFAGRYPNAWLGVSIENQETADQRIPLLLQTPAAVRWVSAEPLLGPVDLIEGMEMRAPGARLNGWALIDWVVCGGESGPHARPMHPDQARTLRDQCKAAGVPFFFKQWGEWIPMMGHAQGIPVCSNKITLGDGTIMGWAGTKRAGRRLNGELHDEYPKNVTCPPST
ncbi:MAG: hypothetical protein A2143_08150 [Gallionellales bacterium RBG_16_57_15]|nr:MAG: hypothetical protein A2143_08150 [Gallionellales bacterium RBG_16_57_15]